jgi:hypothetical protein
MRTHLATGLLVSAVLVLLGCSAGANRGQQLHPVSHRRVPIAVAKADLTVGTSWSINVCGVRPLLKKHRTALGPDPVELRTDAPGDGDLVPADATAVAVCPIDFSFPRHDLPVQITGRSLRSLVTAMNAEAAPDPHGACPMDLGWSRYLVFKYAGGPPLPVYVDSSGCGKVDNGAQQRLGGWTKLWDYRLDQATR